MDFLVPIAVLISISVVRGDIFLAVCASVVTCLILYVPGKKMSLTRFSDLVMHGCCKMQDMDHALSQLPYAGLAAGLSAASCPAFGLML